MRAYLMLAAACSIAAGCSESTGPAAATMLVVVVTTTGGDQDLDGYELRIDGGAETRLEPCCGASYQVISGQHELELSDVAPNCAVTGDSRRSVVVESGEVTRVEFEVTCRTTGIRVTVATAGVENPFGGYVLHVDGVAAATAPANGEVLISRLVPGIHTLEIGVMPSTCVAEGQRAQAVQVYNGEVTEADLEVLCGTTWGVVRVEVSTSGYFGRRIDYYRAQLSPDRGFGHSVITKQVPPNGVHYLSPATGVMYVRLMPSPDICGVLGPKEVTIRTGGLTRDTVPVGFNNYCDG